MATAFQTALVNWAVNIANDNTYYYYYRGSENWRVPPHFDCATFLSYVIYQASGWNDWYDRGYFWPHISDPGFDDFLTSNGWTRYYYNSSYLTEGAIIITDESLGHTLMYIGNSQICDANDYFGHGANSIAVRSFPTYSESSFYYIYLPPDVTPGPGPTPGPTPEFSVYLYKTRKRRRKA